MSGNDQSKVREVEAEAVVEENVSQAVITHREGDEKNQNFWRQLVVASPQTLISKETAEFSIRQLLVQTVGYKAHRMAIDFDHDPITVEGLFSRLEKLCGGSAGWQLAQKLGGF